mgnify:CR=1 FL=1
MIDKKRVIKSLIIISLILVCLDASINNSFESIIFFIGDSAPFKILLFVMADGWNLIIGSLVKTFY